MSSITITLMLGMLVLCSGFEGEEPQDEMTAEQMQREEASMKRTACLVLSRYHSNANKDMVESVVATLEGENQNKFINKMYAMAVERCMPTIQVDQAQLFFRNAEFDPSSLFYILDGFNYPEVAYNLDELTPNQKSIIKFMKQFDQEMAVKREEREAEESQELGYDKQGVVSIFGLNLNDFGTTAGVIYLVVFLIIVGVGLWWGFSHLNNSSIPKSKTHKQKKKQKKRQ